MACCGSPCTVPFSRFGSPYGFGCGPGYGGLGYGGLGYGGFGGYGGAETSGSLGTLSGVIPSCVGQLPPSEVVIQLPASMLTLPGPILSASCEPVAVGGYTPCVAGGYGHGLGGYGLGGYGQGGYGLGGYGLGRYGLGGFGLGGYSLGGYGLGRYGPCGYGGYGLGGRRGFLGRRSLLAGSRIYGCPC